MLYFVVVTLGLLALVAASGVQLSPINIDTASTQPDQSPLNIDPPQVPLVDGNMENTGGIIKFTPDSSQPNLLGNGYILQEVIFHWGGTSSEGSEHHVDGVQSAAEIQFVHFKQGAYSIVAVRCAASSTGISGVWSKLNRIPTTGSRRVTGISYADLFPVGTQGYYRYSGSHTISPYVAVEWFVMKGPIDIPNDFLNSLRVVQLSNHASPTNYDPQVFEFP